MSEIVLGDIYLFTAPPRVVMKEKELSQTLLELDVVPTGTFYLGLEGKMFLNKDYQKYVERWFQNKEIIQSIMFFVDRPWDSFSWKKWMASASNTRNCCNSTFMGFASYLSSEAFSQQFLHLSLSRLEDIYWSDLHGPLQLGWISNRVWLDLNLRLIWFFFFCSLFVSSVDLRQRLLNLLRRWGCHDSLI